MTLLHRPRDRGGRSAVVSDQGAGSDSGAYLIDSIEYIPPVKLPPSSLFDDRDALADLLDDTKSSIEDQDPG
jgi:hypothetical protein